MSQAKKKKRKHSTPARRGLFRGFKGSMGVLITGVIIGSLGTNLWQGWRDGDSGIGSGIQRMLQESNERVSKESRKEPVVTVDQNPQEVTYDFYTVLPEIEVVVPEQEAPPLKPAIPPSDPEEKPVQEKMPEQVATIKPEPPKPETPETAPPVKEASTSPASSYMLQAGSFSRETDAEQQKARIAFLGLGATIQKVSIQGRGDFYRVRLGPYDNFSRMETVSNRLKQEGIEIIRLKVSRGR